MEMARNSKLYIKYWDNIKVSHTDQKTLSEISASFGMQQTLKLYQYFVPQVQELTVYCFYRVFTSFEKNIPTVSNGMILVAN